MAAKAPMIGGRFMTTPWFGPTMSCGRQMLNAQPSAADFSRM
jgi:hypothetical protein